MMPVGSKPVNVRSRRDGPHTRRVKIKLVTSEPDFLEESVSARCPDCGAKLFVWVDDDGAETVCPECTCFATAR